MEKFMSPSQTRKLCEFMHRSMKTLQIGLYLIFQKALPSYEQQRIKESPVTFSLFYKPRNPMN